MTYQETLNYLYKRLSAYHLVGGKAYKPGLDNTLKLMEAFGNPHQKFQSIHIAGTNGKGSVSHYLSAILQQAGYKVGLYTSPHLVDFGERIRIDGKMISEQYVVDFIADNQSVIADIQPSFFELTMAMAFNYFAEQAVDIAIVEVGLGGRLDSTNIIQPLLSVITNIGLEHVEFLGNSLAKIAFEKAGIIKPNIPVVIGEALAETKPIFIHKATEVQAPIFFAEAETAYPKFIGYEENSMLFNYQAVDYHSELLGLYQLKNLATVFLAVKILNQTSSFIIKEEALASGISKVCSLTGLRGRWELLQNNPTVIADTAHNVAGMQVVVNQLQAQSYQTLRIVIGMVNDKDVDGVLQLLPQDAQYYFTQAQIERALSASELREKALLYGLVGGIYEHVEQAIGAALKDASAKDLVLITGSNFVVGEGIAFKGPEEK
jgi:dihydrofolate synthase/folylpolyglutamate synthase